MNSPDSSMAPSSDENATNTENTAGEANVRQKVAAKARQAGAKIKATAGDAMATAREKAEHLAADKRETAANRIGGYSSALHDSADSLEEKDPNVAWFAHRTADKLQEAANYVRTCDMERLRSDAATCARNRPLVYFGGMFAAGLILGNLLKASPRKAAARETTEESWDENAVEAPAPADLTLAEGGPAATWGGA